MHQGHPFRAGIREIVESAPPASLRRPVVGVKILPDSKQPRAKPRLSEIESLLDGVTDPGSVRMVDIDYASRLNRVPDGVARFSHLEYAHVGGRRIKNYEALAGLSNVKSLFITNYTEPQLWPMTPLALESFRSIGDSLDTCEISSKKLWLQRSKLRRFDGGRVRSLRVEKCKSLDLESIGALDGLEELIILSAPKLPDLAFLANCPKLKRLDIFSALRGTNLDELERTTIERVTIQIAAKQIEEVGTANPELAITNGSTCYIGGKPADHFKDFHGHVGPAAV